MLLSVSRAFLARALSSQGPRAFALKKCLPVCPPRAHVPQHPRACRALCKQGLGRVNLSEVLVSEAAQDVAAQAPCAAAPAAPSSHFGIVAVADSFLCCYRFKVFADYEAYVRCQEKVSELYLVSASLGTRQGSSDGGTTSPPRGWVCTRTWVPGEEAAGCAAAESPRLKLGVRTSAAPMGASLQP